MSNLLDANTVRKLKSIFEGLEHPVELVFFTQEHACPSCREQEKLLREIASISDKITLRVYDFVKDGDVAVKYGIDKIPATAVIGKKDYGIRFYGLTGGYEFTSFIETIVMVSKGKSGLTKQMEELLSLIKKPLHLQVMVTLTCPYCPKAVHIAHQMAVARDNIRADMVDASEFPTLAQRYNVSGVPRTIINEAYHVEGAVPVEALFIEILKSLEPEEYQRLQREIQKNHTHIRRPKKDHTYEVIVVGGGPAGMSAAVYSARKDLDVLLISKDIGGQIIYTNQIDNFLGLPGISGHEMAQLFRHHVEQYPIAEHLGTDVVKIDKKGDVFEVITEDNHRYTSYVVVYCAGKKYRRLGVPGEEKFIGNGIAFCATCDAPLYRGKRVAVIGGGNSAFTAVRDLLNYAHHIYLIHRRDKFRADKVLIDEIAGNPRVKIYKNMLVKKFLGDEYLTGIRLVSTDGKERFDLAVDGVFLEIGLDPNTEPVKNLIKLNDKKEIPVVCDNSTSVEGFFAAGDVTDIPEKQIVIAVGDGAKAALSAHRYLVSKKFTDSSAGVGMSWQ